MNSNENGWSWNREVLCVKLISKIKKQGWYFPLTWSSSNSSLTLGFPQAVLPLAVGPEWSWWDRGGEPWPTGSKPNLLQFTSPLSFSVIFPAFVRVQSLKSLVWENPNGFAGPWRANVHSKGRESHRMKAWSGHFFTSQNSRRQKYEYSYRDSCLRFNSQSWVVNDN